MSDVDQTQTETDFETGEPVGPDVVTPRPEGSEDPAREQVTSAGESGEVDEEVLRKQEGFQRGEAVEADRLAAEAERERKAAELERTSAVAEEPEGQAQPAQAQPAQAQAQPAQAQPAQAQPQAPDASGSAGTSA